MRRRNTKGLMGQLQQISQLHAGQCQLLFQQSIRNGGCWGGGGVAIVKYFGLGFKALTVDKPCSKSKTLLLVETSCSAPGTRLCLCYCHALYAHFMPCTLGALAPSALLSKSDG